MGVSRCWLASNCARTTIPSPAASRSCFKDSTAKLANTSSAQMYTMIVQFADGYAIYPPRDHRIKSSRLRFAGFTPKRWRCISVEPWVFAFVERLQFLNDLDRKSISGLVNQPPECPVGFAPRTNTLACSSPNKISSWQVLELVLAW